jgi:hypothetical protein
MKKLTTALGDIISNKSKYCVRCGALLTQDNDSGWEVFVTANVTQSICVFCEIKENKEIIGKKVEP